MDVQAYLYEEAKRHISMIANREAAKQAMALTDSMNNALIQVYSESERELIYKYLTSPCLHTDVPPRIREQAAVITDMLMSIEQCAKREYLPPKSSFPLFPGGLAIMISGFSIVLFLPDLLIPLVSTYAAPMSIAKLYKLVYLGYVMMAVGTLVSIVGVNKWWVDRCSDKHKRFFPKLSRR